MTALSPAQSPPLAKTPIVFAEFTGPPAISQEPWHAGSYPAIDLAQLLALPVRRGSGEGRRIRVAPPFALDRVADDRGVRPDNVPGDTGRSRLHATDGGGTAACRLSSVASWRDC